MEIWADIKSYEGLYQISNHGFVKSLITNKILKPKISSEYYAVNLYKNEICTTRRIHRLVAMHFIDNPENKPQVNHKDADKLNNHVSNLEWSSRNENMKHAFDNGLLSMPDIHGDRNGKSKITEEQATDIRRSKDRVNVLAAQHGISKQSVWDIKARRSWKHIN